MNSSENKSISQTKVSIGMPVYNGERTIRKALDSLLSQTFTNFELIISDNASTDSTPKICGEYSKRDHRIHFITQKETRTGWWNFWFVLQEAKCEYFMWAAADDIWESSFIEKNLRILESNSNIVGSISNADFFGRLISPKNPNANFNLYKDLIRNQSVNASYEEKASFFMRNCYGMNIYSLFRIDKLRKSFVRQIHPASDLSVILKILKYGDLHIIDEFLMHRDAGGTTSTAIATETYIRQGVSLPWIIFPHIPFTFWAAKHVGIKFFIKELPYFIRLNLGAMRSVPLEFGRLAKRKYRNKKIFQLLLKKMDIKKKDINSS
jgi:glycosyltransferase involved in cell wall biosynthesis